MGLKPTYDKRQFERELEKSREDFVKQACSAFFNLGKKAVDIVVADGNYVNRTGVLRSSIGCGVFYNGIQVSEYGFFTTFGPESGASLGRKLLYSIGKQNVVRNQVKLVVVAGADYASFVEANENYRVLVTGVDFIESNLQSILRGLNFRVND